MCVCTQCVVHAHTYYVSLILYRYTLAIVTVFYLDCITISYIYIYYILGKLR